MVSTAGILLTAWTARAAVGCYLLRLLVDVGCAPGPRRDLLSRWFWTSGCLVFLVHVACAFHFYRDWSHLAAYEHTARRTWKMTGIRWGGGIYFNDALAVLWTFDAIAWWLPAGRRLRAHRWYQATLHVFFAFMIVNATAVFGPPFWRWLAPAAVLTLFFAASARRIRERTAEPRE